MIHVRATDTWNSCHIISLVAELPDSYFSGCWKMIHSSVGRVELDITNITIWPKCHLGNYAMRLTMCFISHQSVTASGFFLFRIKKWCVFYIMADWIRYGFKLLDGCFDTVGFFSFILLESSATTYLQTHVPKQFNVVWNLNVKRNKFQISCLIETSTNIKSWNWIYVFFWTTDTHWI